MIKTGLFYKYGRYVDLLISFNRVKLSFFVGKVVCSRFVNFNLFLFIDD